MKLEFNDIYKYADFKNGEKPKLKDEYWKTYFAVIELYMDWVDMHSYNFGKSKNVEYKQGYYVIPIMIWPQNCVRKRGIYVYPRKFETIWSKVIESEPHDIPKEHWKDCENFKHYWGLAEHMNDRQTVDAKDIEIYDNIDEAINRSKNLDQLLNVLNKLGKLMDELRDKKQHLEDITKKIERSNYKNELYHKLDETKKEIYIHEISEIESKIKILEKTKQKLGPAYNNKEYKTYIDKSIIEYRLSTL